MSEKRQEVAVGIILFIPIVVAMIGFVMDINFMDIGYLLLVLGIFVKFYMKNKS